MKVAKIDCTAHTPICASENIKAYPSFILYSEQQKFYYHGSRREVADFDHFAVKSVLNLRDGLVPVHDGEKHYHKTSREKEVVNSVVEDENIPVLPTRLTKETFQKAIEEDFTFVDFFAPWCSHCVKLEPTWRKLADAMKYSDKVRIAQVDCTQDPELCQAQQISGYPTLNLYKDGYFVEQYQEARTLSGLVAFMQKTLVKDEMIEMNNRKAEDNHNNKNQDSVNQNGIETNIDNEGGNNINNGDVEHQVQATKQQSEEHNDNEEEEELEFKLSDETYKGLMAQTPHLIYFHNSGPEFSNMDLIIFEQVQHRLRLMDVRVRVAVLDCSKINTLCTELGIHVYPSVLYFTSLLNYSQYFGLIDVEKLVEFAVQQKVLAERTRDEKARDEL